MDNLEFLFSMNQGENKVKQTVAKALSEKLQTEVDKNKLIEAIDGIDVGAIVQAVVKKLGIEMVDIIDENIDIRDSKYANKVNVASINLVNANKIGNSTFYNAISLEKIEMPNVTSIGTSQMYNCLSIKSIDMPNVTSVSGSSLLNCISIRNINIPNVTSISNNAFLNCISLKAICLGTSQIATLSNTNALQNTPIANGTGHIFVPDDLVDSYKTATNWSVYADQIKPMSEYVEE